MEFQLTFALDSTCKLVFWIGIGIYMAAMLGIGLYCSKRVKSMNDY